jgi:hypothetical protein
LRHLVLYSASGRFDFLPGARAQLDAAHRDALRSIAIREKLRRAFAFTDQARFCQSFFRHLGAFRQLREIVESDDLMLYTKDIRETALWHTAGDRHLAALELGLAAAWSVMPGAGLDTLVSLARRLAGARARTTSESLAIPVRSRSWNQIVQANALNTL